MSKLERWIIYPMLFLSLFCAWTTVNPLNANEGVPEVITARRLAVVDEYGQEKVIIDKTSITLLDVYGGEAVVLYTDSLANGLDIWHENGASASFLVLDGGAFFNISSAAFANEVEVVALDDCAELNVYQDSLPAVTIAGDAAGGYIFTHNPEGGGKVSIAETNEGDGGVWIFDRTGQASKFYGCW